MRLFGHPVHVMLIHFPVALWPAHAALHLFAKKLPTHAAAIAGFWLLAAGTLAGWLASLAGAADLVAISEQRNARKLERGLTHAAINGTALLAFTAITAWEYARYPEISHGVGFLACEALLVIAVFAGNYFGAEIIWRA